MQSFTGSHLAAVANYREVLKYDKNNAIALNNLGYTLAESGEYTEANILLNKLITVYPDFTHGYCTLGYLKILEGKLEEGKLLIDKSLKSDPEDAYAYKALGIYYNRLGNTEMESSCFDKAIELDHTLDINIYITELKSSKV
jgi:tetratricopeptide (TPR) repeat protein